MIEELIFVGGWRKHLNPRTLTYGKTYFVRRRSCEAFAQRGGKPWVEVLNDQGLPQAYSVRNFVTPEQFADWKQMHDAEKCL